MERQITVYGIDACEDTQETRRHLKSLGVSFRYINIEQDENAREWVLEQNDGEQKTPTVDLGGLVLSVPSDGMLDTGLRRQGFVSRHADTPPMEGPADQAGTNLA